MHRMHNTFRQLAASVSHALGTSWAFLAAVGIVAGWALAGPVVGFSSGWQLVINTGTTIVTFLMVFLIQNTQNRDSMALHLKLDELISVLDGPRNRLVDVEEADEGEVNELIEEFRALREEHREAHPATERATTAKPREEASTSS